MSKKSEERAYELYPDRKMQDVTVVQSFQRLCYQQGYEQAEKDLALTWKDVAILITIYEAGIENGDYRRYNDAEWMKEYSQDILRRFNEIRKK